MVDDSNNSGRKGWRERVGVKNGMPKLADDFKSEPQISRGPAANTPNNATRTPSRPAPRPPIAPRPVAAPAPMAPRRPVTPAPAAPSRAPVAARPAPKPPSAPVSVKPSDAFGDRLRAQRQAAESLAAKRAQETRDRLASGVSSSSGPKFSFAEDEIKAAQTPPAAPASQPHEAVEQPAPVQTPPVQAAPVRPQVPGRPAPRTYQPSDAYRQTHGYRDYDQAPPAPRAPEPRSPDPRAPAAYDRYGDDRAAPAPRAFDRSPRTYSNNDQVGYADANDDMFETPQSPSQPRRAGASDYTAAYRDYDDAFEYDEEPRKKSGIWIFIVLMILIVAAIFAGALYYLNFGSKIGGNKPASNVPTITAPDKPVKVTPTTPDNSAVPGQVKRKKIYDRILGDQTLEPEKLVPTEETPVQPVTPAPTNNGPPEIEPLPLPLPPPPTVPGVQGNLSGKTNKVAAAVPSSGQTMIAPTIAPVASTSGSKSAKSNQGGGQAAPLSLPPAGSPPSSDTATNLATPSSPTNIAQPTPSQTPDLKPAPLPRSKPAIIVARARQAAEQSRLAALARDVTPRFPTTGPAAPTVPRVLAPATPQTGTGPVQLSPRSSGGTNFNSGSRPAVTAPPPTRPHTNIASLPQPRLTPTPRVAAPTVTPQAPAAGSGYVIQLSSFRNREGANAEYRRLASRHSRILSGLQPQISEADLGASGKFYKLRLGSIASRSQAARLCNNLIAAGEKDCLVRKQ